MAIWVIVERPDPKVRELEQLGLPPAEALYRADADSAGFASVFSLNGLKFNFDAGSGQKTGAFLDQRLNYAAAARGMRGGEALDVCTYQGGFALHMAQVCDAVTGVDASRGALEVADRNHALNPQLKATVDWIEADAFELLREMEASGQEYDTIVLDPPAFAKSRAGGGGVRCGGYKELNLRAMKMVREGGSLITCSCSHHVPLVDFMGVVRSAAVDAGAPGAGAGDARSGERSSGGGDAAGDGVSEVLWRCGWGKGCPAGRAPRAGGRSLRDLGLPFGVEATGWR